MRGFVRGVQALMMAGFMMSMTGAWADTSPLPASSPAGPVGQERYPENVPAEAQAQLFQLLHEELTRLQQGIPFVTLVLLNTNDPMYRAYLAAGILHQSDDAFTHLESGMASVLTLDGLANGKKGPVCYVMYHPDEAGAVYRDFVVPVTQVADERSAAAYLMGHEVGHCLDRLERHVLMAGKMVWNAEDVAALGLSPVAVQRVYGATVATATYEAQPNALARDNAQRQYEERVADVFGLAWVWRLGGADAMAQALETSRSRMQPWQAHFTTPALEALNQPGPRETLGKSQSVSEVWRLARQIQQQVGVDPSLGPGSDHAVDPMSQYLDAPASSASTAPRPLPQPQGRNFNDLPRFGQP
jgi:hypothetical protein